MGKKTKKVLSCLCLFACCPCCFPCYIAAFRNRKRARPLQDDYMYEDESLGPKSPCDVRPLRMSARRRISLPECIRQEAITENVPRAENVETRNKKSVIESQERSCDILGDLESRGSDEIAIGREGQVAHLQTQSLLLAKLPPELRRMIWQECLGRYSIALGRMQDEQRLRHFKLFEDRGIMLSTLDDKDQDRLQAQHQFLPLLQTCRRIYSEAIPLIYSRNTFNVFNPRTLLSLSTSVLPNRLNQIRQLNIKYSPTPAYGLSFGPTSADILAWQRAIALLSSMRSLQSLHVVFLDRGVYGNPVKWVGIKELLEGFKTITQTKRFTITLCDGGLMSGWNWNGLGVPWLSDEENEDKQRCRDRILDQAQEAPFELTFGAEEGELQDEGMLWLM